MGDEVFDYFGGTAELPEDPSGEELDLSGLKSVTDEGSEMTPGTDSPASFAERDDEDANSELQRSAAAAEAPPADDSHWLDLASSLGLAVDFGQSDAGSGKPTRAAGSRKGPPAKPRRAGKPTVAAPPARDQSSFGQGLFEPADEPVDELRQKQLLSEMFVPTGDAFEEPAEEVRQIDDVEILEDDMVEFEVEELGGDRVEDRRDFERRPPAEASRRRPRGEEAEAAPESEEGVEPERPRQRERGARDRGRRDRGDRGERTERGDRGERSERTERGDRRGSRGGRRSESRGDRSPQPADRERPEKKVRSEVLPADEDFIIDPLDDVIEDGPSESTAASSETKSIRFPTWNETISPIIEANIARHAKSKGSRRPPRDRGGRD